VPPEIEVPLISKGLRHPPRGRRACGLKLKERDVAGEETITSGMAGRYANALFELALEQKNLDAVKTDLDGFEALLSESADLDRVIRSPVFSAEEQRKAIAAVLAKMGIGGLAANFLLLVAAKRRLFAIRAMLKDFRALVARHKGEVTAEVTVAEKLNDKHLDALKRALKDVTGKDVDLNVKIDPAIIGGLIVKVGSRMVDTSLKTKLNAIKHAMKEVG
jgi:F-type H+-transporting ATPase subunit delta